MLSQENHHVACVSARSPRSQIVGWSSKRDVNLLGVNRGNHGVAHVDTDLRLSLLEIILSARKLGCEIRQSFLHSLGVELFHGHRFDGADIRRGTRVHECKTTADKVLRSRVERKKSHTTSVYVHSIHALRAIAAADVPATTSSSLGLVAPDGSSAREKHRSPSSHPYHSRERSRHRVGVARP